MQSTFKSKQHFLEWRSHWRKDYKLLTEKIRGYKTEARKPTNNSEAQRSAQGNLRAHQIAARSLLIARESVKSDYGVMRTAARVRAEVLMAANPTPEILDNLRSQGKNPMAKMVMEFYERMTKTT
jgi:hypothetical protein